MFYILVEVNKWVELKNVSHFCWGKMFNFIFRIHSFSSIIIHQLQPATRVFADFSDIKKNFTVKKNENYIFCNVNLYNPKAWHISNFYFCSMSSCGKVLVQSVKFCVIKHVRKILYLPVQVNLPTVHGLASPAVLLFVSSLQVFVNFFHLIVVNYLCPVR